MLTRLMTAGLGAAVFATFVFGAQAAHANDSRTTNCIGSRFSWSCVTQWRDPGVNPHVIKVPQALDPHEVIAERDRRWVERCRPSLRYDEAGVRRYRYAARGCEFGRYQD